MPLAIQKGFSVTILTALSTSIILGMIGWFGQGTLQAYNNTVDVGYVKGQMETMNQSLVEIIVMSHHKNVMLEKHELRIQYCEKQAEKCEEYREQH